MRNQSSRYFVLILCLALLLQISVASAQETATPTPAPTMAEMSANDITIRFAARVGSKDFACGMTYDGLGSDNSSVQASDFRFYVSNVRLIDAVNKETPLELEQDGLWQYKDVALLDFEDGTASCGEGGNELLRTKVTGNAPTGTYTGIVFDLGVPFELNHLDISTAQSPLNLDAMWWGWQVGFKFLRIDMTANGNPYFIHLGSTGCVSENETTAPDAPCSYSNRTTVRLEGFNPAKNFVVADLATLVSGVKLSESSPRPPGCMSGPDDSDCQTLFPNLGLALDTGLQLADASQNFFRVE